MLPKCKERMCSSMKLIYMNLLKNKKNVKNMKNPQKIMVKITICGIMYIDVITNKTIYFKR